MLNDDILNKINKIENEEKEKAIKRVSEFKKYDEIIKIMITKNIPKRAIYNFLKSEFNLSSSEIAFYKYIKRLLNTSQAQAQTKTIKAQALQKKESESKINNLKAVDILSQDFDLLSDIE